METINSLIDLFKKFPGIGPRQARRFVYYLLTVDQSYLNQISDKIKNLKKSRHRFGVYRNCLAFSIILNHYLGRLVVFSPGNDFLNTLCPIPARVRGAS